MPSRKKKLQKGGKQLVAFLAYFSTLKMEAVHSLEIPVDFYRTTGYYISVRT
jgi:hypothetical protein